MFYRVGRELKRVLFLLFAGLFAFLYFLDILFNVYRFVLRDLLQVLPPNYQSLRLARLKGCVVFLRRVDVSGSVCWLFEITHVSSWHVWSVSLSPAEFPHISGERICPAYLSMYLSHI